MRTENINEEDIDFAILAVNSHLKMYKLCWKINQQKKYNFKKTKNHINTNNPNQSFSKYTFFNEKTNTKYDILSNSSEKGFLDSINKSVNYFIVIQGGVYNTQKIIESLNRIEGILLVFELSLYKIKSITPFIIND